MSMGTRLQDALDVRRRTAPDVIKACELSKGAVYNILNDVTKPEKVRADTVGKICAYLRINRDWLVWGKGDMDAAEPVASVESAWRDIKATTQGIGLGKGVEADEYAEAHRLKFRADSLRKKRLNAAHLEIAYGKGDSMEPRIRDGDAIMFDRSDTKPKDGALFIIQVGGAANHEPQAKRCLILDDLVYFEAINPAGDHDWKKARRMDSRRQPIEILGRVRWIAGWVD